MSVTRARCASMALCLAALPLAAHADYKDSYKQAIQEIDKENWAQAAKLLQKAVDERPQDSGENLLIYGKRFEPYLPQYYLGLALYKTGNCEGAVAAWDLSETQGAVRKKGDAFKALQKNRDECRTKLAANKPKTPSGPDPAQVSQAAQAAEGEISRAEQAERAAAGFQTEPLLAKTWEQDAALGPALERGRQELANARSKLDAGKRKPDLAALGEARDSASRAQRAFETLRTAAAQKKEEAGRKVAAATPRPTAAAPVNTLAAATPTPAVAVAGGPPADLVAAADAFFAAKYAQAADRLRPDGWTGRAAVHGFLMRAAARHALYVIGGERDGALLRDAQEDVRSTRKLDPALAPDPQAFSPRFLDFYKTNR